MTWAQPDDRFLVVRGLWRDLDRAGLYRLLCRFCGASFERPEDLWDREAVIACPELACQLAARAYARELRGIPGEVVIRSEVLC